MTEDPNVLMERETGGATVQLKYLPLMRTSVIEVHTGDVSRAATVPNDEALDAFEHPALYLPTPLDVFK